MPLYMIHAEDKPGSAALRAKTRPRHLDYLETIRAQVVRAGPFLDEDGVVLGSLILAEFDDLLSARAFAEGDPYAEVGLFAKVTVAAWRQVIP
jgi:uncharacterized protein